MAQLVDVNICINGRQLKQFSLLSLSQSIFEHHNFQIVCPMESIDGTAGNIFDCSREMVGGNCKIKLDAIESTGSLQFSGVVTQVETARYNGHPGDIIITGCSPTIILDNGPHCKSWEKKTIKNIAQDVLKHFPQNLLQPSIAPLNSQVRPYTVQYKETAWQFLNRLSASYGEWLFYDGTKLVLAAPKSSSVELSFGSNLERFNVAMQVRPAKFQMLAYDYTNSKVYDGTPNGIASQAGLNDLGKYALQKSQQFYGAQPKQWNNYFLTNKKELDEIVNIKAAIQSSNTVRFNGTSGHPGVQIGSCVRVKGINIRNQSNESFGEYRVISATHQCDGLGNYINEFEAIPSSVKLPPVAVLGEPHCETQSAFVTDNYDPQGLGRIRVKFHWMNGIEKSPWLRIASPHGGGNKGMFFIPEIGEEVIVGFEGSSAQKPFILGTVYHEDAKTEFGNEGNDIKVLQTRSGNTVVMNDKEGSVLISDSKGNNVKLDGKGNIYLFSSESIEFKCGEESKGSMIKMRNDGTISLSGKNISTRGSESVNVKSKKNIIDGDKNHIIGESKLDGGNVYIN